MSVDRYRAGKRLWRADEDALLKRQYPHRPTAELATRLGRSIPSTYNRAKKLGLRKSDAYLNSPSACRLRRGDHVGAAHRFLPGHRPANKGLRRPGYSVGRGRMQQTQFKAGERSGVAAKNWCPIGTIRPDPEGYLRIKVAEGVKGEAYGFGNTRIWPLLNRHVWTQAHGPIPPGHSVVFKDGNRQNCVLENLECISRRDLMKRNTVHNLPKPLASAIQLLGQLKRRIREREERTA